MEKKKRKKPYEAVFIARSTYFHEYLLILGLIFFEGSFLKDTLFGDLKTELPLWSPTSCLLGTSELIQLKMWDNNHKMIHFSETVCISLSQLCSLLPIAASAPRWRAPVFIP